MAPEPRGPGQEGCSGQATAQQATLTVDYPDQLPANKCWANTKRMRELHPELRFVKGWLIITGEHVPGEVSSRHTPHAWNETADGTVVDATAHNWPPGYSYQYEEAELDIDLETGEWRGETRRRLVLHGF